MLRMQVDPWVQVSPDLSRSMQLSCFSVAEAHYILETASVLSYFGHDLGLLLSEHLRGVVQVNSESLGDVM